MEISSKTNVVEITNEIGRGFKILQHTIWTLNNAVNNKKALLYTRGRSLEMMQDPNTAMTAAASSMAKPQNFHKKLDFPSFKDGRECDYPSFKRKWNATVATAYPDSVQRDIIQDKIP